MSTSRITDHEPIAERTGLPHAGRGDAARLMGAEGSRCAGLHRAANKTLPVGSGRGCLSTGATESPSEPCDRAVRRSARRLMLLGKPVVPGPCWRDPSSSEGDNARRGARLRARHFTEYAAELPSCVTGDSGRDEQDGRSVDDRQLGRIPSDVSLLNVFGGLCVLGAVFFFGFCW